MRAEKSRLRPKRAAAVAALLALGILLQACSSKLARVGDGESVGFRHRKIGYTIAVPEWGDVPAWERRKVKGTDLAFRDPRDGGRSVMSLLSRCRRTAASPQVLARHLTIGLSESELERSGPLALKGRPGWSQTFLTLREGVLVHVKTVTVVSLPCVFDWILVMPRPFGPIESVFDRWWTSFSFPPGSEAEREPGSGAPP